MADKLRTTYPHKVTFVTGEQPSAAKLSAISSQTKAGLNIIEKAVGDIWGTGDSDAGGLHQTNLGRVLGDAKYINPALYTLYNDEKFFYIENLSTKWIGKTTGYLSFRPAFNSAASGTNVYSQVKFGKADGAASTKYTTAIGTGASASDITVGDTDFYINVLTGEFKAGSKIEAGDYIGYWVDPAEWSQSKEGFDLGVIPDPRTANSSLTIETTTASGFDYKFSIPNREPHIAPTNTNTFGTELPDRIPVSCLFGTSNLNDASVYNAVPFASSETSRFWDSAGTTPFYKYNIPSKPATGAAFAEGDIYLWDITSNSAIEGLEFFVDATDEFQINIKDNAGRLAVAKAATSPTHSFCLITHGSSLAKTIWTLSNALVNHTHTGAQYNEANLDHATFLNLYPTEDHSSVAWMASTEEADDHIHYLHREGSKDSFRDQNKGALLGDLIVSENAAVGDSYLGDLAARDSYKIYFGENTASNPSIRGSANKILNIDASVVTDGYTESHYFSARTGTSITDGYTFDQLVSGGGNPDPSLLGIQWSGALYLNAPADIVLNLDTNETASPGDAKFAINNGAGTEVFKVEESGDISGPSGTLTVAGDLTVTEDISADNVSLSERLDLDHASLLPTITTGTPSSSGNSPAGDYVYAIQAKLLNGQYSNIVETEVITLPANNEVSVTYGFPKNTASYKLFRMEYTEVGGFRVNENIGSFEKIFNASELAVLQDGFTAGDMQSLSFVDGDSSTVWDTSSIGAWTPETTYPPLTVDNTTSTIDTNASIETMGDIHAHGNLSNLCPEGNIAVAGIRFKSNSDTSSSSMITGIEHAHLFLGTYDISGNTQQTLTVASGVFDTTDREVLSVRPSGSMGGGLSLDYWYVDEINNEIKFVINNPNTSAIQGPQTMIVNYIQYGDFYA